MMFGLLGPSLAVAQPPRDEDLGKRVQQLEKRVAELEQALNLLQAEAKAAPKTEIENKLVGPWVTADKAEAILTNLRFHGDGSAEAVIRTQTGAFPSKYKVVGENLDISVKLGDSIGTTFSVRLVSVTDKELVLEHPARDGMKAVSYRYTRLK